MDGRRLSTVVTLCCGVLLWGAGETVSADWPYWRGPTFNGVAASPPLVEAFAEGGPKKVWETEPLYEKQHVGHGSVTVAGGRVYALAYARFKEPIEERTLPGHRVNSAGYAQGIPEELSAEIEKARVSDERKGLKDRKEIENWINTWLTANVPEEQKRYRGTAQARLRAGESALPLDVLAKLNTVRDKPFPNQDAFEAWLKENQIPEEHHKGIRSWLVTQKDVSRDFVHCLDVATGKTIWKTELDSWWMWYPASSTPTVVNGKCYVLNSEAAVCCLDAQTGEKLWKSEEIGRRGNTHNRSSSVLVVDGVAVAQSAAQAAGFDAQTGETLWKERKIRSEYGSAVPWESGGKKYAVIVGAGKVFCVEPKTGNIVWSVKAADGPTPTILGDRMAISNGKDGLTFYKLTDAEPEVLWSVEFDDTFTSPVIHDGHVYAFGEAYGKRNQGRAVCVDAATGKVLWSEVLGPPQHSSPALADGKLIAIGGGTLYLVKASPEKYTELGKLKAGLEQWSSVSFADGKVFLRTGRTVVCYDLTK